MRSTVAVVIGLVAAALGSLGVLTVLFLGGISDQHPTEARVLGGASLLLSGGAALFLAVQIVRRRL